MKFQLHQFNSMKERSILSFVGVANRRQSSNLSRLQRGFGNSNLAVAEKHGGYKPHLVLEDGLLKRLKQTVYYKHFVNISDVKVSDLEDIIDKTECLVTKENNVSFDHGKMVRCAGILVDYFNSKGVSDIKPILSGEASKSLNMSASSAFPYYRKKGFVLDQLIRDAETIPLSQLSSYPVMRAFRLQLRNDNNRIVPKLRVIYPYPGVITLHEQRFVKPLMDKLVPLDTFYATGMTGGDISNKIKFYGNKFAYNCSTDISKFDQTIPTPLVNFAFSVVRSLFSLGKDESVLFEFLVDYFVNCYLTSRVGKGKGRSVIKRSGIPSGTGFTNLIGTIAHMLMLLYYDSNILNSSGCMICSDDNLMFTNVPWNNAKVNEVYSPWNMNTNKDDCQFNKGIGKIHFLGFDWVKQ